MSRGASTDEMDPIIELCKLIKEAGLVLYFHTPGCPMKIPCDCTRRAYAARDRQRELVSRPPEEWELERVIL